MVEKELMDLIQIFSQIASATGVCFAAYYYITTLKNAEREKRKQTILQKLPTTMSKEFGDSYYFLNSKRWKNGAEFLQKHRGNLETMSAMNYVTTIYNALGILYKEGLMSIDDITKLYPPAGIINVFEKIEPLIPLNRKNSFGEDADTEHWVPFEHLYHELKRRYPGIEGATKTDEEWDGRMKRWVQMYS